MLAQDATVTATMMQNLGLVLGSLQPTKDAVIRVSALLIVKVDWTVAVHQLTAAQQLLPAGLIVKTPVMAGIVERRLPVRSESTYG